MLFKAAALAFLTNDEVTMIKFIHAADVHLDSPLRGLSRYESAPAESIRDACRRAFENLVELAIKEKVAFVLLAGDLYDGDWKDYSTGLFFRSRMVRLQQAGIPVFLIAGNHDAASVISRKLSLPENVRSFSSHKPETMQPEHWPVALHGMGFPNRAVDENLVPRYPAPVPGKFNIGILHTSLAGNAGHELRHLIGGIAGHDFPGNEPSFDPIDPLRPATFPAGGRAGP